MGRRPEALVRLRQALRGNLADVLGEAWRFNQLLVPGFRILDTFKRIPEPIGEGVLVDVEAVERQILPELCIDPAAAVVVLSDPARLRVFDRAFWLHSSSSDRHRTSRS